MREISGGSAIDSKIEDHEGRCLGIKRINSSQRKTKEKENVMHPFNRFSMKTSLDRSQILNYTTDFHIFPVRDGRFVDLETFQISISEVAEYLCFHLSPVF